MKIHLSVPGKTAILLNRMGYFHAQSAGMLI